MRSLIIGMGIGKLYKDVLTKLGHEVVTVDPDISKGADFPDIKPAILVNSWFDTAHICTPNFTHKEIAKQVAPYSKIIFIEKPGLKTSEDWTNIVKLRPFTRFIMVKNNMWRSNIADLKEKASKAKSVNIEWIRKNCIPSPGSWFTNKDLAFGGVSRDLMPHLLSLYISLNSNWRAERINEFSSLQQWQLKDVDSTEYGVVNPNGIHNVDDKCSINFGTKWHLEANWRSLDTERSAITFINQDNSKDVFELGWCPEEAYSNMIQDVLKNVDNHEFWKNQFEYDTWIHERIEQL